MCFPAQAGEADPDPRFRIKQEMAIAESGPQQGLKERHWRPKKDAVVKGLSTLKPIVEVLQMKLTWTH